MTDYLTVYKAHRTDAVKKSILIRASSIGLARLAARKVFGEGVSFTVRMATKDEIAQAREIIDEAEE